MNGGPRIALDAMGGDSGPAAMVAGAARALRRDPSLQFLVYGDQAESRPSCTGTGRCSAR